MYLTYDKCSKNCTLSLLFTNLDAKEDYFYQEDSYIYAEDEKEYENSSLSVLAPSLRQECFPASCNGKFCMDRCPCIEMNGELKPPPNKRNDSLSEGVEIKKGNQFLKRSFFSFLYQSYNSLISQYEF